MDSVTFPLRSWLIAAVVFVLAFDLAFVWQWSSGAYESEFGGHPDEAAHYVTGLMIRDYLAQGAPSSPLKFADDYYRHYPKIGLGVWPPVFYLVQSSWTLPFGVSRTSMLLLMCALAALLGLGLFRALREEVGSVPAGLAVALFLSLPLVREYYSMIMAETLGSIFMFGATLAFGRYLDEEKTAHALWFGFLAALAILTKGTGVALVLVVPLALLFSRKWHFLVRPALWASAALTAVLAGPWTWHFRNEGRIRGGWLQSSPSWSFTREALPYYAQKLALALGLLLVLCFVFGLWTKLLSSDPRRGRWAALGALILSVFIFQAIMPVGLEARHLLSALPAVMMFAAAGISAAATKRWRPSAGGDTMPSRAVGVGMFVILLVSLVWFEAVGPTSKRKLWTGFRPLAQLILEEGGPATAPILVSSDGSGEGMFISEMAMGENRPGHLIERSSKVLARMEWSGANYHPQFADDEALLRFLRASPFRYVVLDDTVPEPKRAAHHDMLKRVLLENPARFAEVAQTPVIRGGVLQDSPARLYRILP